MGGEVAHMRTVPGAGRREGDRNKGQWKLEGDVLEENRVNFFSSHPTSVIQRKPSDFANLVPPELKATWWFHIAPEARAWACVCKVNATYAQTPEADMYSREKAHKCSRQGDTGLEKTVR